jgi:hypothetical protein
MRHLPSSPLHNPGIRSGFVLQLALEAPQFQYLAFFKDLTYKRELMPYWIGCSRIDWPASFQAVKE